jgi:hypothetical protein
MREFDSLYCIGTRVVSVSPGFVGCAGYVKIGRQDKNRCSAGDCSGHEEE